MHDTDRHGGTTRQTVVRAIEALAIACDHALARDDSGFSKSTAGPGHEMAALGPARWTDEMWTYAGRLAAHHSQQLLRSKAISEREFHDLKAHKDRRLKSPFIPSNWADLAEIGGKPAIVVSNSFSPVLKAVLERFPREEAFQPAGAGRLWRISARFAFVLSEHLDCIDILDPRVRGIVQASLAAASEDDLTLGHHGPIVEVKDGAITFNMPFDNALHAALKATKGAWINVGKSWQDVTYTVVPDKRGHAFMQTFLTGGYNPAYRAGAMEEVSRLAGVEPPSPTSQEAPNAVEPVLDIRYADEEDVVLVAFRPFNQAWLDAIKALPPETRSYREKTWRVSADRQVLRQLAEGIADAGPQDFNARAAMAIHEFIEIPDASRRPPMP
ncbi:hypothetical protein HFO56_23610 [Rhizobium laguerreae]|uniref:hypothetical protein n=1 Tax=Rhizobium laguerreae TaxID=1076926 RepID=UPI001C900474|nr:hypothetical protein [Rhizobium laguerreae]MBY3155314.1 hypothetical protein [Rhizobium laguerreae]